MSNHFIKQQYAYVYVVSKLMSWYKIGNVMVLYMSTIGNVGSFQDIEKMGRMFFGCKMKH